MCIGSTKLGEVLFFSLSEISETIADEFLQARDVEKALDGFTHAVQLDPDNGEAWNNIACLYALISVLHLAFSIMLFLFLFLFLVLFHLYTVLSF